MSYAVVYATDDNYWLPTFVSVYSLLINNRDSDLEVYVLAEEKHPRFDGIADELHALHDACHLHFIKVDGSLLGDTSATGRYPRATFMRLLIPDFLSDSHNEVLYIDGDTVVDGSIRPLLETELDGSLAGASPQYEKEAAEVGLPPELDYFQTGILKINLRAWRERQIGSRALSYLEENPNLRFPLQETLNVLLHHEDGWLRISPTFNVTNRWAPTFVKKGALKPIIVHFTGTAKPWQHRYSPPYGELWWSYVERSPCGKIAPVDLNVYESLRKGLLTWGLTTLTRFPSLKRAVLGLAQRLREWEVREIIRSR